MYRKVSKRLIDVFLTSFVLVILSPILLLITIILLCTGEHQVIYFQKRIGKDLKKFAIWKFTTMLKNSENMGHGLLTVREDYRVLPFGKFLRKTKINELAQLISIIKGDMSIVGPRPLIYNPYSEGIGEKIYTNKPGLTGIGSIIFRDEEALISNTKLNKKDFYENYICPYKGELELWYKENFGFWTDIKLIFCTAWVIFSPKSKLPNKIFKNLPKVPVNLKKSFSNNS
jgi:lipopolysaccharide/colanic/teichoic acid biosynthesis glycosyltransferase